MDGCIWYCGIFVGNECEIVLNVQYSTVVLSFYHSSRYCCSRTMHTLLHTLLFWYWLDFVFDSTLL